MPSFSNYKILAYQNGELIPTVDASFSRTLSEGTIKWSITTAGPLEDVDLAADTWGLAVSVEGKTWHRFTDCVAEGVTVEDSSADSGVTITGTYKLTTNELMNYCAPKTLVFVNQEWVNSVFGYWCVKDGVLRSKSPNGRLGGRLLHPRLPGLEYNADTLDTLVGSWTHHSIARYLANLVGCDLVVSTPDIDVIDTFTVASGSTWFDAIKANFTMWGPNVSIEPGNSQSARPTIYILDVINSSGGITPVGQIDIDAESVDSISYDQDGSGSSSGEIDQVIVLGRTGPNVTFSELPDFTTVRIPVFDWAPNCTVENSVPTGEVLSQKEMGEYVGDFGVGDDTYTVVLVDKFKTTQKLYRYIDSSSGGEQELLLEETQETIDTTGQTVHKVVVEHKYSSDKRPVRVVEREYLYCNFPGSSVSQLRHLKSKHTSHEFYVKELKQSLTQEFTEEIVVCDTIKQGGNTYRDNPNPYAAIKRIDRTRSYIDRNANTNQIAFPMTTNFSRTFISRTSDGTLLKRKLDYDVLSATGKMNSQILRNPKPDQTSIEGGQFRREYFDGPGTQIGDYRCYRKSTTLSHPDIATDAIAEALADRIFARRGYSAETIMSMTIKTSMPIPIGTLPVKATVSSVQKEVQSTTSLVPSSRTSTAGGTFYVNSVSERFTVVNADDPSISTLSVEQTLSLVSRL